MESRANQEVLLRSKSLTHCKTCKSHIRLYALAICFPIREELMMHDACIGVQESVYMVH